MKPYVVLHNMVSLDGRIDGFPADVGLYYEIVGSWQVDATLAGADTILGFETEPTPEDESAFAPPEQNPDDARSLLVIPDSRGRVRNWHALKQAGYWRGYVALVARSTPQEYLDYLQKRHIDYILTGEEQVDMRAALEDLHARYGVRRLYVDSGGTLNGVLLRAGLVDEVSVLVSPHLVGGTTCRSLFRAPDLTTPEGAIPLRLAGVQTLRGDVVWLRYEIVK